MTLASELRTVAAIGGATRVAAVLGWPVEHTRSPALHNAAFAAVGLDGVFVAFEVEPARLGDAVRGLAALGALGASVTVPHKEAVIALCDELAAPADLIGAVNCLVFDRGRIIGHNTDAGGFVDSLAERHWSPKGRRALLLGAGGAARAVAAGLADAGAVVEVIARRPDAVDFAPAFGWEPEVLAGHFGDADLVVDCTSLALHETAEAPLAALPVAALRSEAMVASLVYHRRGPLLDAAARRNLRILDGRGMLVHQGARAFTLWTGRPAPVAVMAAALDAAIKTS
jgi:shikimate dehydrogenase